VVVDLDILHKEAVGTPDLPEEGLEANILDLQEVDLVDIRLGMEQVYVLENKAVVADPDKAELEIHPDPGMTVHDAVADDVHRDDHGVHDVHVASRNGNFLARDWGPNILLKSWGGRNSSFRDGEQDCCSRNLVSGALMD